jgi:trehalose/maltose hydrolase-like predicted phosphorylase
VHLNPLSGRWEPDLSRNQRHVNAAIFYNLWHYFQATEDLAFLRDYGAEMMR